LGTYRTTTTFALGVWLQRGAQCLSAIPTVTDAITQTINDKDADSIFEFVCDFWTDSGAALGNALRELFSKIISLLNKLREKAHLVNILQKWTRRVLQFPRTMRVLYFTIEILSKHVGGDYVLELEPGFPRETLSLMSSNALANPIGKALYAIFHSKYKVTDNIEAWIDTWADVTRSVLLTRSDARDHIFMYFLPQIFKLHPNSLSLFITPLKSGGNENALSVLIGTLKVAQELAICDLDQDSIIDQSLLQDLLRHSSTSLRAGGLSLLVTSPKGSKPIPPYVFEVLKDSMDSLLIESDTGFRNQVHGLIRQFIFRMRGYSYSMAREARKRQKLIRNEQHQNLVDSYLKKVEQVKHFCHWFLGYLQDGIRPGSPYHCSFTGTQMIGLLVQSGLDNRVDSKYHEKGHIPFPFSIDIYTPSMVRLLVDNIANNYEDIRLHAVRVLLMAPLPIPHLDTEDAINALAHKAAVMTSGMRGREGDGGAHIAELVYFLSQEKGVLYLCSLVEDVEAKIKIAREDLATAVRDHGVHGHYTSLRYILEKFDFGNVKLELTIVERIVQSVVDLWDIVQDILCHDSPEGNMPAEMESNYTPSLEAKYGPATQVILSYSWRAVKESTALLKCLLDRCPAQLMPNDLIIKAGGVILNQLATVRHRGAFSSVYPTFISCCSRCNATAGLSDQSAAWLNDNLSLIQKRAQYITRRSGGLPFLVTAVLTADKDPDRKLLKKTFGLLHSIARRSVVSSAEEKMDLPQVHAFNCIKALFIESDLSTQSAILVDQALELAIGSFSDQVWAIRNCAVMLFTALQNRLFGDTESRVSARLFFSKFKGVRSVLLRHLQQHVEYLSSSDEHLSEHVETVYPVLSLLARLEGVVGYSGLDEFQVLIIDCLRSRIWKIREMAARVIASMVTRDDVISLSLKFLETASLTRQNELHGGLLAVLNILTKFNITDRKLVDLLNSKFEELVVRNPSPETALVYFRIMKTYAPFSEELTAYCEALRLARSSKLKASERVLREEVSQLLLASSAGDPRFGRICHELLFDYSYEVQLSTIRFLEDYVEISSDSHLKFSLAQSLSMLFETSDWDQVRGPAVRLLSKLKAYVESETKLWYTLYSSIGTDPTEEIKESALESLGPLTATISHQENTRQWLKLVKECCHEDQPYISRLAALRSLVGYFGQIGSTPDCEVLFCLYYFLSDDDCDLRGIATDFVAKYLKLGSSTCVYAERALLNYIVDTVPESASYLIQLFKGEGSLSEQLQKSLTVDEVLFTVEKQNLFRNELLMVSRFADALANATLSKEEIQDISKWASQGIKSLDKIVLEKGEDGPLGWASSDPDLFLVLYKIRTAVNLTRGLETQIEDLRLHQTANSFHELLRV
jgi:hypothetical protein